MGNNVGLPAFIWPGMGKLKGTIVGARHKAVLPRARLGSLKSSHQSTQAENKRVRHVITTTRHR